MVAYDFLYDGERLSDFGFQLCSFDGGGLETISNGSVITFNQISTLGGQKYHLTSSAYEDCLSATIQICKKICDAEAEDMKITQNEMRQLMQWLNRKKLHELKFLGDPLLEGIRFNASFNVSKIEYGGNVYGLELEVTTDKPFGYGNPVTFNFRLRDPVEEETEDPEEPEEQGQESEEEQEPVETKVFDIESISDEEGYIYPDSCVITPFERGDLSISNTLEDHVVQIKNVFIGEHISMEYPIIESSRADHEIQKDFNWNFFRIANTFRNHTNHYTANIPCNITVTYSPIIKIGF